MCVHKKRAILFGGVVDTEVRGKNNHSSLSSARIRSQILMRKKLLKIFDCSHCVLQIFKSDQTSLEMV
jgi:hypothetical protein